MRLRLFACALFFMTLSAACPAAYTVQEGKLVNKEKVATQSVQEHYSAALEAHKSQHWPELIRQARIVLKNFPKTPFAEEAQFFLGIAYFYSEEFHDANKKLSSYLKSSATPKHFEEAIECKYSIAKQFQEGGKKHLLGLKLLPKWMPANDEALEIFDEVIAALPHHDLAAKALFGKASLLFQMREYKTSIEAFQTVIRRFPKHKLSPESYVSIGEVYLTQALEEFPDPDLLDLTSINLRKFRFDFPSDDKIRVAESMFLEMQEVYAASLYETGCFFEKTKRKQAAIIYYNKIIATYPDTNTARNCQAKLNKLQSQPVKEL
ncbi:MAG: tetratricopeptide repeat protein [Chlamydiota bacterium]